MQSSSSWVDNSAGAFGPGVVPLPSLDPQGAGQGTRQGSQHVDGQFSQQGAEQGSQQGGGQGAQQDGGQGLRKVSEVQREHDLLLAALHGLLQRQGYVQVTCCPC